MSIRRTSRPDPHDFDADKAGRLLTDLAHGIPFHLAMRRAGVSERALAEWLIRGNRQPKRYPACRHFFHAFRDLVAGPMADREPPAVVPFPAAHGRSRGG
jgi:hypothetical protein